MCAGRKCLGEQPMMGMEGRPYGSNPRSRRMQDCLPSLAHDASTSWARKVLAPALKQFGRWLPVQLAVPAAGVHGKRQAAGGAAPGACVTNRGAAARLASDLMPLVDDMEAQLAAHLNCMRVPFRSTCR